MKRLIALGIACCCVFAPVHAEIDEKLKSAMESEIRTEAETARDRNRKPIETLNFFGIKDDMTVIELIPGGGWYTKLLVPLLAENGKYYGAIGTGRIESRLADLAGFEGMNITAKEARLFREEGERFLSLEIDDLGVADADMVLTFRNYHNLGDQGRSAMNKAAFDALKAGGTYAVVDHTARHMEPSNSSNRRRFDPVKAIKEIQAAGFVFVDYADMHYREDDELEYEVGARSVSGNTDRWTLKFMKPE